MKDKLYCTTQDISEYAEHVCDTQLHYSMMPGRVQHTTITFNVKESYVQLEEEVVLSDNSKQCSKHKVQKMHTHVTYDAMRMLYAMRQLSANNADSILLQFEHMIIRQNTTEAIKTNVFIQELHDLIHKKFHILNILKQHKLSILFKYDYDVRVAQTADMVNCIRVLSFCDQNSACTAFEMLKLDDVRAQHFEMLTGTNTILMAHMEVCDVIALPVVSKTTKEYDDMRYILSASPQHNAKIVNNNKHHNNIDNILDTTAYSLSAIFAIVSVYIMYKTSRLFSKVTDKIKNIYYSVSYARIARQERLKQHTMYSYDHSLEETIFDAESDAISELPIQSEEVYPKRTRITPHKVTTIEI